MKRIGFLITGLLAFLFLAACAAENDAPVHDNVDSSASKAVDQQHPLDSTESESGTAEDRSESQSTLPEDAVDLGISEPDKMDVDYQSIIGSYQITACLSEASGKFVTVDFNYEETEEDPGWGAKAFEVTATVSLDALPVQTIVFAASLWPDFAQYVFPDWRLIDVNFDGYLDLFCVVSIGGVRENHFYSAWLYDPDAGLFVEDTLSGIGSIANLKINSALGVIESSSYSGATGHWHEAYRYQEDGTLLMVAALNLTDNENGVGVYREYDVVHGEKVLTFEVEVTEQNQQLIHSRYYDPANRGFWYFGGDEA